MTILLKTDPNLLNIALGDWSPWTRLCGIDTPRLGGGGLNHFLKLNSPFKAKNCGIDPTGLGLVLSKMLDVTKDADGWVGCWGFHW